MDVTRNEMIKYLRNHDRHDTMNSWNCTTSYSKNIKIYNLGLDKETEDALWDVYSNCYEDLFAEAEYILNGFCIKHEGRYQIGFNGRSGGYLVLYQGEKKKLDYKSTCTACGQKNYKTVEESGCKCSRCGKDSRVNLSRPLYSYNVFPGRGMDMDGYDEMDDYELHAKYELVKDFDATCENWLQKLIEVAKSYQIVEEIVYQPVITHKLVQRAAFA